MKEGDNEMKYFNDMCKYQRWKCISEPCYQAYNILTNAHSNIWYIHTSTYQVVGCINASSIDDMYGYSAFDSWFFLLYIICYLILFIMLCIQFMLWNLFYSYHEQCLHIQLVQRQIILKHLKIARFVHVRVHGIGVNCTQQVTLT